MNLPPPSQRILEMLAHDLKNPLQCIQGYSDLLLEERGRPERVTACALAIVSCSRHALSMIEDIMDAAAIGRGLLSLRREPVDVRDVVAESTLALRAQARARRKKVGVTLDAPPEPVYALADRDRLLRVVGNLLANALRHAPETGGRISVVVRASAADVLVEVADNGSGIEPGQLEGIFQEFVQLDPDRGGSLGLGLYIARRILVAHGGWIRAFSEGAGKGASFVFRLARLDPPAADWGPAAARGALKDLGGDPRTRLSLGA